MQSITKNVDRKNMTGNRHISIASTDEIKEIRLASFNAKSVVFKPNQSFGKIEATDILLNCREEEGNYLHEISCRMVSTQGKHDALFNRMKNKRWIVRVIDNNNLSWLSGSLAEPLRFRWEHIGEEKAVGQHAYELFFERKCSEPLYSTDTYYKLNEFTSEETAHNNIVDSD
jgi:hypothetical protein